MTGEPVLDVTDVLVTYKRGANVLQEVSVLVRDRELVAVLGPNGAGKTTLLRGITGTLSYHEGRVAGGHIVVRGVQVESLPSHRIAALGVAYVPEGRRIFPGLTVEENLEITAGKGQRFRRGRIAGDLQQAYDFFPALFERRRQLGGSLSGGEQQMLALGRAVLAKPRLLVIDELSLGLAPLAVEAAFAKVEEIRRELAASVLLVEQNAHMALAHADRAYVIEAGRITAEGSATEIANDASVQVAYFGG